VDKNGENPIAFIPGVLNNKNCPHCFIQVFIGSEIKYYYIEGNISDFSAKEESLWIKIRDNIFSLNDISLDLSGRNSQNQSIYIKGNVKLTNTVSWPDKAKGIGTMGVFNYIKFLECYSQVCSLHSKLKGSISINGKTTDYTDGCAYVEKNWGRDFPRDYFWVQSSGFREKKAALTLSYGRVPLYLIKFNGFLGALYLKDRVFLFTSMNGSSIKMESDINGFHIKLTNKKYVLIISTYADKESFYPLMGPCKNKMIPDFRESLKGIALVKLTCIENKELIFEDYSNFSGIEFGGNLNNLK
jgi:tocopherol cyclase